MANEEVTQVEEVKEAPATREIAGITIPVSYTTPDDTILQFKDSIKDFTVIELIHEIKKFEKDLQTAANYREFFETSKVTIENFKSTIDNLGKLDNDLASVDTDSISNNLEKEEELNFDEIMEELNVYEERTNIGLLLLKAKYDAVKEDGGMSLKDDIIETLVKNMNTVEQSSDLNKDIFKSCMENVITEFNSAPNGILDPYSRFKSKLTNPKRLHDLVYQVVKYSDKARKEYLSVGFTDEMFESFVNFIKSEEAYFVYTHDGLADPNEPPCLIQLNDKEEAFPYISSKFTTGFWAVSKTMYEATKIYSLIFFYHISRIVRSESKKRNYLSLIYKCFILQALELYALHPDVFRSTTESMENRKSLEEGTEDYEISRMRQKLYESYSRIFWAYLTS